MTKKAVLEEINGELVSLETDMHLSWRERAEQLRLMLDLCADKAANAKTVNGHNQEQVLWEYLAYSFQPMTAAQDKGAGYGPQFTITTDDGKAVSFPDVADVSESMLTHLRARARDSTNPWVTARFADLHWEFAVKRDPSMAILAAKNHLRLATERCDAAIAKSNPDEALLLFSEAIDCLLRAAEIARQMKNAELMGLARDTGLNLFDAILVTPLPFYPGSKILSALSRLPTNEELTKEIDEKIALLWSVYDKNRLSLMPYILKGVYELEVAWARQHKQVQRALDVKRRFASEHESFADAHPEAEAIFKHSYYQVAHDIFVEIGSTEDMDRVRAKLSGIPSGIAKELKPMESTVRIPCEAVEYVMKQIKFGDARAALRYIGQYDGWLPAKPGDNEVERIFKEHLFLGMVNETIVDESGHLRQLTADEKKRKWQLESVQQHLSMLMQTALPVTFGYLMKERPPSLDDLRVVLADKWMSEGRVEILTEAFDCYANKKYVSCAHVIIPQIEGLVRDLVSEAFPERIPVESCKIGALTIDGSLFSDEQIRAFLSPGMCDLLAALLFDTVGARIRHMTAHGNISAPQRFNARLCELLLYVVLWLSQHFDLERDHGS